MVSQCANTPILQALLVARACRLCWSTSIGSFIDTITVQCESLAYPPPPTDTCRRPSTRLKMGGLSGTPSTCRPEHILHERKAFALKMDYPWQELFADCHRSSCRVNVPLPPMTTPKYIRWPSPPMKSHNSDLTDRQAIVNVEATNPTDVPKYSTLRSY